MMNLYELSEEECATTISIEAYEYDLSQKD